MNPESENTEAPFYYESVCKLYEMEENEFVIRLLNEQFVVMPLASAFVYTLKDARQATGREPWTGVIIGDKFKPNDETSRMGQLTYLLVLEQMGRCFKRKSMPEPECKYPLYKALYYYAHGRFSNDEMMALVALRHAFAHNYYSAINIHKHGVEHLLNRVFNVTARATLPVIKLGKSWNGDLNYGSEHISIFNPIAFCQVAEEMVSNLRTLASSGELEIALKFGLMEMKKRFVMAMRH